MFHSRTDVLIQTERGNDKAVDPRAEHVRDEFIDMILIFVAAHKCERITVSAHGVFYFAQKKSIMRSIGRTWIPDRYGKSWRNEVPGPCFVERNSVSGSLRRSAFYFAAVQFRR